MKSTEKFRLPMTKILKHLEGIDKPEEYSKVEFVNNPVNYLVASYNSWKTAIESLGGPIRVTDFQDTERKITPIYQEAERVIQPNLKGINLEDILSILRDDIHPNRGWAGMYLTMLLNKNILNEIIIKHGCYGLYFVGYKMQRGKIVVYEQIYNHFGDHASGGRIENFAHLNAPLGHFASGGIFVNHGEVHCMAHESTGGIHINNGKIATNFGMTAENSFMINSGEVKGMLLDRAKGCFMVNRGKSFMKPKDSESNIVLKNNLLLSPHFVKNLDSMELAMLSYNEIRLAGLWPIVRQYFDSKDKNIIYVPGSIL